MYYEPVHAAVKTLLYDLFVKLTCIRYNMFHVSIYRTCH